LIAIIRVRSVTSAGLKMEPAAMWGLLLYPDLFKKIRFFREAILALSIDLPDCQAIGLPRGGEYPVFIPWHYPHLYFS